jgi:hemoglobin
MTQNTALRPEADATSDSAPCLNAEALAAAAPSPAVIDEAMIARLVDAFYTRARQDDVLGPVFSAHVEDWPRHLARIVQFWSSVLLATGTYTGSPMQRHAPLPIDGSHFQRWLALFAETAREVCPPNAAARFIEAAQRMARSLQLSRAPLPALRPRAESATVRSREALRAPPVAAVAPSATAAARIAALRALLPESGNDAK